MVIQPPVIKEERMVFPAETEESNSILLNNNPYKNAATPWLHFCSIA
jgi:hypothetical protein